jgi:peptidoglycan L-alanyl-D-glutamate endopeptidase CwlK
MTLFKPERLKGVHPDLCKVILAAVETCGMDMFLVQGERTEAQHTANLASGKSRTTKSRHVPTFNKSGMACAVDIAPCAVENGKQIILWNRTDLFFRFNTAVQKASARLGIPVEWGGAWVTFKDFNHWQLPRRKYP